MEKELFGWKQFRRLSESKPTKSKTPTPEHLSSKSTSKSTSKSKSKSIAAATTTTTTTTTTATPLQRMFDYWNDAFATPGRDDASLARYPSWKTPGGLLRGADYAGTLTFALTGTITAAQSGLDVFGSVVVGIITSVGGGTIRDAIFLNRKPFWTEETEYIWMGLVTGLLTFFVWPKSVLEWQQQRSKQRELEQLQHRQQQQQQQQQQLSSSGAVSVGGNDHYDAVDGVLDTLDAIGLSAFAIIGAQNGIRAGMPLLVCAICGMTTATFGGLIRDILCDRPVRIVHSNTEVYAPPALAGATVYLVSKTVGGASPAVRIGAAFATCMGSRFWAIQKDVKLQTWDTNHDNLGVTVRKRPTKPALHRFRNND
jgi:uncharacterized membrane protein YeiH